MAQAPGKRPFWMHQLVEYVLGGALIASGLKNPTPLVPAIVGALIVAAAACTRGALSAFRLVDPRVHRLLDPALVSIEVVAALQPWIDVEWSARATILVVAVVHTVVWRGSAYVERTHSRATAPDARSTGDRSTEIGRTAGRVVGSGVNAVRRAQAARKK